MIAFQIIVWLITIATCVFVIFFKIDKDTKTVDLIKEQLSLKPWVYLDGMLHPEVLYVLREYNAHPACVGMDGYCINVGSKLIWYANGEFAVGFYDRGSSLGAQGFNIALNKELSYIDKKVLWGICEAVKANQSCVRIIYDPN